MLIFYKLLLSGRFNSSRNCITAHLFVLTVIAKFIHHKILSVLTEVHNICCQTLSHIIHSAVKIKKLTDVPLSKFIRRPLLYSFKAQTR